MPIKIVPRKLSTPNTVESNEDAEKLLQEKLFFERFQEASQHYKRLIQSKLRIFGKNPPLSTEPSILKKSLDELINQLPEEPQIISKNTIIEESLVMSDITQFFLQFLPVDIIFEQQNNINFPMDFSIFGNIDCLDDLVRTKKFLLAIRKSIQKFEHTHEVIHVNDAGCGVFPVMGIYAALCSKKVRCDCLELNPYAAKVAKHIVKNMNLEDQITVHHANALEFQSQNPIDLLISETMHTCLKEEPIVKIMHALTQQMSKNSIVLPSKVNLYTSFPKIEDLKKHPHEITISTQRNTYLPDLSWEKALTYDTRKKIEEIRIHLPLSNLQPHTQYIPLLACDVELETEKIDIGKSLITQPIQVFQDGHIYEHSSMYQNKTLSAHYKPGAKHIHTTFLDIH